MSTKTSKDKEFRKHKIVEWVCKFYFESELKNAPNVRETRDAIGIGQNTLLSLRDELCEEGAFKILSNGSRTFMPTEPTLDKQGYTDTPTYPVGVIGASPLKEVAELINNRTEEHPGLERKSFATSHLTNNPDKLFVLKVEGESMKDAGIHHGDYVIFEKVSDPKNVPSGTVIAAGVNEEATLKYYMPNFKENKIALVSANKELNLEPIEAHNDQDEFTIFGIARELIREGIFRHPDSFPSGSPKRKG